MNSLRRVCSVLALVSLFSVPVFAGDISTPGRTEPGDIGTPGVSVYDPGDIGTPGKNGALSFRAELMFLLLALAGR